MNYKMSAAPREVVWRSLLLHSLEIIGLIPLHGHALKNMRLWAGESRRKAATGNKKMKTAKTVS